MHTKLKKINEGFTIVETLIVLAIAALIITIVLIAVPALQRSAANTNILHDAQDIASTIQTFEGNNQGTLPSNIFSPQKGPDICIGSSSGGAAPSSSSCTGDQAKVQGSDLVYFLLGNSSISSSSNIIYKRSNPNAFQVGPGQIDVWINAKCVSSVGNNINYQESGVAIYYPIQTSSSGGQVGCIQV